MLGPAFVGHGDLAAFELGLGVARPQGRLESGLELAGEVGGHVVELGQRQQAAEHDACDQADQDRDADCHDQPVHVLGSPGIGAAGADDEERGEESEQRRDDEHQQPDDLFGSFLFLLGLDLGSGLRRHEYAPPSLHGISEIPLPGSSVRNRGCLGNSAVRAFGIHLRHS